MNESVISTWYKPVIRNSQRSYQTHCAKVQAIIKPDFYDIFLTESNHVPRGYKIINLQEVISI